MAYVEVTCTAERLPVRTDYPGIAMMQCPGKTLENNFGLPPNHVTLSEGRYFIISWCDFRATTGPFRFTKSTKSSIYIGPPWRIVSWCIPSWNAREPQPVC
jgi:hypothetical protein